MANAFGDKVLDIDAAGNRTDYRYDKLSRLTQTIHPRWRATAWASGPQIASFTTPNGSCPIWATRHSPDNWHGYHHRYNATSLGSASLRRLTDRKGPACLKQQAPEI